MISDYLLNAATEETATETGAILGAAGGGDQGEGEGGAMEL
jgi:hypothetical protein